MSKKRRRDIPAVNTELVEVYDDLANEDEEIRLKAAQNLLLKVDSLNSEQLHEILRRLIRGLCSGRKAARLGFSIALTELQVQLFGPNAVNQSSQISVSDVVETLDEQTRVTGNASGQEERDHHFGRLFGAEAIIKSGVLFNAAIDLQHWSQIIDIIINLARQKSWLREECGWILYQAILYLDKAGHDTNYIQLIIDKVHENGLMRTSDGVAICIAAMESGQNVRLPKGDWQYDNPLHHKGKAALAAILKESSRIPSDMNGSESKISQKGNWSSKLHFSWQVIISHLLGHHSSGIKCQSESLDELDIAGFWDECVDKSLFTTSSSDERKYWGFLLFQRVVQDSPTLSAHFPFTPNLMRSLMNQLGSPDRYLHRIAEKSIRAVLARAQIDDYMAMPILESLLSPPNGQVNFDQVTKTKTIEKLLLFVKDASLNDLVKVFHRLITNPGTQDMKSAASRRQVAADLLVAVVRSKPIVNIENNSILRASGGVQRILSMLAQFAYFNPSGDEKSSKNAENPQIHQASHDMFKARLSSCLTHLTSKVPDPVSYAYNVVEMIHTMDGTDSSYKLIIDMDEDVSLIVQKAWNTLQKLSSKEMASTATKKPLVVAFKFLYSLTILQVYNGDADAINVLDELQDCYKKLIKHRNQETQGGSDAMIEIILSFVSKPSRLYRHLGQQAFSACAPLVSMAGLQAMFKVLETEETLSGQENIFEDKEEIESGSETFGVEHVDVIAQKMKNVPTEMANSLSDSASDINDSSSAISVNEDGPNEADNDQAIFDAKLAQALGIKSTNEDGSVREDHESSDEDMDDEQMEALDHQLEKVFRERKKATSAKSQQKDAKEMIANFKCRVLELLEIFVKQQFTNSVCICVILPLLVTIRTTKSNLVSSKACNMVKEYSRLCGSKSLPKIENVDETLQVLKNIHCEASKEGSKAFTSACSQFSLLLVKVITFKNKENLRKIFSVYSNTQEQALFNRQCKVKASFFTDWLNWCFSVQK